MRSLRKLGVGILCLGCAAGAVFAGCSSDDSSGNSSTNDAGGGGDAAAASTLYSRLGGHAGIRGAVDAIVAQELNDPDIVTYFFNQTASVVPAGHPTADQLEECFTDLLAKAAGGTEAYPETVTDDAGSFACRSDMGAIHQPLKISGGTFTKFVMIAGTVLQNAKVASSDIATIASVLDATQSEIVDPNLADAGSMAYDAASP